MKTKILLPTLLLLCLFQFAQAQTQDSVFYRHSLGVVTSPVLNKIFTANRELPIGLVYKRQININSAFRISVLTSHDSYKFTSDLQSPDEYSKLEVNFIQISSGYEWQLPISRRWQMFYGIEAGLYQNKEVRDEFGYRQTDNGDAKYTLYGIDHIHGILFRPFSGISLQLNNRIYIATETAISAKFQRRKTDSKWTTSIISSGEVLEGEHSNGIWKENSLKYQPISNISILLRF